MSRLFPGRVLILAFATLAAVLAATPASAQSLFARGGLGFVTEPLDARARGVGGVALGLPEFSLSLVNPAGIARLPAPTAQITFQPERSSADFGNNTVTGETSRFPLVHIALPLGERWAASVGYGALLDRSWAAETTDSLVVGEDTLLVRDRFSSRGGVADLRLGVARRFGERFGVGVGIDIYTGSVRDSVAREFGEICQAGAFAGPAPVCTETVQEYSGVGYAAGVRWDPSEALGLAAALSIGGELTAERQDSTLSTQTFDLPLRLTVGGNARVTSNTVLALSGGWNGWSSLDDVAGSVQDTWSVAGGLEWDAISLGQQTLPLRVGGRYATLPFRLETGGEFPRERVLTAGAGLRLAGGAARADFAVERGERGGEGVGLDESFWRLAVSLALLGR